MVCHIVNYTIGSLGYAAFTPGHMSPGNTYPGRATCIRIHICRRTHVAGYKLFVRDTCGLYLGDIIILLIYVTVDLYPFVSNNRRATNWWRQFCRRYKMHVDDDKWIQVDTTSGSTWCKRDLNVYFVLDGNNANPMGLHWWSLLEIFVRAAHEKKRSSLVLESRSQDPSIINPGYAHASSTPTRIGVNQ